MLGKLLKYDMKNILKSVLPIYIACVGFGIVLRLFYFLMLQFPIFSTFYGTATVFYVFLLVGVVLWTMIATVKYFSTNLLKDEGYLTNTLPVSKSQLIFSKEIMTILILFVSIVVVILGFILAFYQGGFRDVLIQTKFSLQVNGIETSSLFGVILVVMAINYLSTIQLCFISLLLGQTKNNNRLLYSVAFGVVIYMVLQILSAVGLGIDKLLFPDLINVLSDSSATLNDIYRYVVIVLMTSGLIYVLVMVIFHFICVWLSSKRLNLE